MRSERRDGGGLGLNEHAARRSRDEEGVEEHPSVVREEGRVLRLTALLKGGHVARHETLQQLVRVAALQGEHAAPGKHGVPRLVQQVPLHGSPNKDPPEVLSRGGVPPGRCEDLGGFVCVLGVELNIKL